MKRRSILFLCPPAEMVYSPASLSVASKEQVGFAQQKSPIIVVHKEYLDPQ